MGRKRPKLRVIEKRAKNRIFRCNFEDERAKRIKETKIKRLMRFLIQKGRKVVRGKKSFKNP